MPAAAGAHTALLRVAPAPGAKVEAARAATVTLVFTAPLDLDGTQVHVLASDASRVDRGAPRFVDGDPTQVEVRLRRGLAGPCTVAWRTVSPEDGHAVAGAFGFTVKRAPPSAPAANDSGPPADRPPAEPRPNEPPAPVGLTATEAVPASTSRASAVARIAQDVALTVGFGLVVFLLAVFRPVVRDGRLNARGAMTAAVESRTHDLLIAAATLGVVSAIVAVGLQGAVLANAAPWGAAAVGAVPEAVTSWVGGCWLAIALAWLVVLATVLRGSARWLTAAALGLLVVLAGC